MAGLDRVWLERNGGGAQLLPGKSSHRLLWQAGTFSPGCAASTVPDRCTALLLCGCGGGQGGMDSQLPIGSSMRRCGSSARHLAPCVSAAAQLAGPT